MDSETTCWTIIDAAAAGNVTDREAFARRYTPVIHAYLAARWRGTQFIQHLEDAIQDVFVECFRNGGPLERAERGRPGGFHAFLYAIVRNIALRTERQQARHAASQRADGVDFADLQADETSLSRVFDRAWATGILEQAADRQAENATREGVAAQQRVELLRLRFQEGLPIRDIASKWNVDAAKLHREYGKARNDFADALRSVISFHYHTSSKAEIDQECLGLLRIFG